MSHHPLNGAILNIAKVIDAVVSSLAEAELAGLFIIARKEVHLRQILTELVHPQTKTPTQMDKSTAEGVINSKIQPKLIKLMDMHFEWLKDRETKEQFRFFWRAGKTNLADFFTKHHSLAHHRYMCADFLTQVADLKELRERFKKQVAENILQKITSLAPKSTARVY